MNQKFEGNIGEILNDSVRCKRELSELKDRLREEKTKSKREVEKYEIKERH